MRTSLSPNLSYPFKTPVGMKPLSERDENFLLFYQAQLSGHIVGMKPLSERDENPKPHQTYIDLFHKM